MNAKAAPCTLFRLGVLVAAVWFAWDPRAASPGTTPYASFFHCEGRDTVSDATGEKVCFRGVCDTSLAYGVWGAPGRACPGTEGTDYFRPVAAEYDKIAQWGFNVVRVSFEWRRLLPPDFSIGDSATSTRPCSIRESASST